MTTRPAPPLTERAAQKLALDWTCVSRRRPWQVMEELRRMLGHPPRKDPSKFPCRWEHVYVTMWPLLMESPTYAERIRRAVNAAKRRESTSQPARAALMKVAG
ncbi:hypothetical protein [Azospirillum tabaci]|uniref:hypothetical protein n=1 Tax=Azospirillum tabaci TaxID=2752310 RepID=UPI001660256D|nr:hypothetical protein [Azospirillum tabaci]